ncbi:MAG TPA: MBL fold metallo-hydrolase [Candidatus Limnocylindria bacterium]|nr:MBL fold metallo-hydrolase [Candidatus Limnocylindria bacterium]
MRLTVLGRSPARPNPGEACAGYLLEGGGTRILMDVGPGVVAQLLRRTTPDELDAVVVSHMHTDHFLDLVTLRYSYPWLENAARRLRVVMPPGSQAQLEQVALGAGYRDFFDRSFDFEEHDGATAFEIGRLRLEPYATKHFVPTWGFRVESRGSGEPPGRVFAYSADSAPTPALDRLATDVDLFLCEAALKSRSDDPPDDAQRGHLLPCEAGEVASRAHARRLILTHLPTSNGGEWAQREAESTYEGSVEVAEILRTYEI